MSGVISARGILASDSAVSNMAASRCPADLAWRDDAEQFRVKPVHN